MPLERSPTKSSKDRPEEADEFKGFEASFDSSKMERTQDHLIWQLDRLEKRFIAKSNDVQALTTIAVQVKKLAEQYNDLYATIIETVSAEQLEQAANKYAEFDDQLFDLTTKIEYQIASMKPLTTTPNPCVANNEPKADIKSRIKLPEIKLPQFDGNIREWPAFRDAFKSLIDASEQLSDCDKLSYLVASVSKEARSVIDGIDVTSSNYGVAWNLLTERYENKYVIQKAYVEALFELQPLRKECPDALHRLLDEFDKNLRMLEKEGEKTENWSTLLVFRLCSLLDSNTLRQWELHRKPKSIPTYQELLTFLRNHCHILKSISKPSISRAAEFTRSSKTHIQTNRLNSVHAAIDFAAKCLFCSEAKHSAFRCERFKRLSVAERRNMIQSKGLCFNCMSSEHKQAQCTSSCCKICGAKHHTMLHFNEPSPGVPSRPKPSSVEPSQSSNPSHSLTHCTTNDRNTTVLLQTVLLRVLDRNGQPHFVRGLLDSASQLNLVTERLVQRLRLPKQRELHTIGGIGQSTITSNHAVNLILKSRCSEYQTSAKFRTLREVTRDLPAGKINAANWEIPKHLELADPCFYEPGPIDLIIGAELYYDIVEEGLMKLQNGKLALQRTLLGWVLAGSVKINEPLTNVSVVAHAFSPNIEEQLSKFWELETCTTSSTLSVDETRCEQLFEETTVRDNDGRFIVQLPKRKEKLVLLGNSKDIAIRRFLSLERRLSSNPALKTAYTEFITEYRQLNHMTEIDENKVAATVPPSYYLPHHCITRPDSTTTKLRVVFDASCASDSGTSLNDALMVGPILQDDLMSILLRFRIPKFVLIADIEKMYRQIYVAPSDRPLQRIVWRNNSSEPLRTFELNTVTYGTACAPYLATKTLNKLAQDGATTYPEASTILQRDFYMDDMLTGVNGIDEGRKVCQQLMDLLHSGGFNLRKWATNERAIFTDIPMSLQDERTIYELDSKTAIIKTLGLKLNINSDFFLFDIPNWTQAELITKRIAVSDTAKLFDPLGLLGPIIVLAKMFLQDLWKLQISWDEPLDSVLQTRWMSFRDNLTKLQSITIPRRALSHDPCAFQLHGFCDASERAYGAVIYLRSIDQGGEIKVNLFTAKSRVAPLADSRKQKRTCLPRLELSAALLLVHLYEKVITALKIQVETYFWTDSTIVLHWLAATPSRWKSFVANRVSEIQHATVGKTWCHVPGKENPADIISRGMEPGQLQNAQLWWHGPDWLSKSKNEWPSSSLCTDTNFEAADLEERQVVLTTQVVPPNHIFQLRSTYSGLQRVVAWLRRIAYNTRTINQGRRRLAHLSLEELDDATKCLIRLAQNETFSKERTALLKGNQIDRRSNLKLLNPFMEDGLLRVGGRLHHAAISYNRKHPFILPSNHPLTDRIATYYHRNFLHAGPQLLIACLRERFWPLRAKNLARRIVHSCHQCFKCRPTPLQQIMGDLPAERVTPTLPFLRSGVDLCGPILYRHSHRKAQVIKGYVAIFVCMAVKAVHIELVADLSTKAFLAALRRFTSRRGKPALIECDNAKNFVGASREIKELAKQFDQQWQGTIINSCIEDGIQFKFIPPRSPNFGGLWEAAVKSFKTHLRPTIGNTIFTYEELNTLLIQIEGCLNSRPLTPMSNEPSDLDVLTPGHFLVHRPIISLAEPSLEDIPLNRLDRWQQVQEYLRRLWKRWSTDYLSGLQPRTKWTSKRDNVQLGTMVLVKEDGLPPFKWCLGRIIEIIKGQDGNVRVVIVKTKDGNYKRAISKICVLPVSQQKENETISLDQ